MLIRCESCGKMFDYDKRDGQCPACGAFAARPTAPASAPEAPAAPAFAPGAPSAGGVRGSLRTAPRRTKTAGLTVVQLLLAVLGVIFLALSLALRPPKAETGRPPQTGTAQLGQPVQLGGREVTFSQPQRLTGRTAGLPQGWQLYRIRVSADELEDWDSGREAAVSLYAGGGYWQLSIYDLERLWPELAEEALNAHDLTSWDALDGWLYLAGPADENAALVLEDQLLDKEYDPHTQTVLTMEPAWEEASEA